MNIRCTQCGHVHPIPDEKIANKRVYFFCQNCGRKISIDAVTNSAEAPINTAESAEAPDWKSLFSSIPSFFSRQAFFITLTYHLFVILLAALFVAAAFKHSQFFIMHRVVTFILFYASLLLFLFARNMTMYYISKIHYYKLTHKNAPVDFHHIHFDLRDDILTVFLFTLLCSAAPAIVLFPVCFAGTWGVLAGGILFPLFLLAAFIAAICVLTGGYLTAYFASASLFTHDQFEFIIRFFKREWIFFPFFSVLISGMRLLFAGASLIVSSLTAAGASFILFVLLGLPGKNAVMMALHNLLSGSQDSYSHISAGLLLCLLSTGGFLIVILALNTLLSQSLYAHAILIMKRNPAESFNALSMALIFAGSLIILIALSFVLKSCGLQIPIMAALSKLLSVAI